MLSYKDIEEIKQQFPKVNVELIIKDAEKDAEEGKIILTKGIIIYRCNHIAFKKYIYNGLKQEEIEVLQNKYPEIKVKEIVLDCEKELQSGKISIIGVSLIEARITDNDPKYKKNITLKDVYNIMKIERPNLLINIIEQAVIDSCMFDPSADPQRFLNVCRKWKESDDYSLERINKKRKEQIKNMDNGEGKICKDQLCFDMVEMIKDKIAKREGAQLIDFDNIDNIDLSKITLQQARQIATKKGNYIPKKANNNGGELKALYQNMFKHC